MKEESESKTGRHVGCVAVFLLGYFLLYPIYAVLDYFNIISSDRGVGIILYYLFLPLGVLERYWEPLHKFLEWLFELLNELF